MNGFPAIDGPAGLILAAGVSSRMPGRSKLRRRWARDTVLGAVLEAARRTGLDPVVVVGSPGTKKAVGATGAIVLEIASSGKGDSLATGLAACPPGPVVVLLGDEPGIDVAAIRALCQASRERGLDLARVAYRDRPGHPVWVGDRIRSLAVELTGDESVWDRLRPRVADVGLVEVDMEAPIDVDSPAALRRARDAAHGRDERS